MTKAEINKRAKKYAALFKKYNLQPSRMNTDTSLGCGCVLACIAKDRNTRYRFLTSNYFNLLERGFMYGTHSEYKNHEDRHSPIYKIGKRVAELVGL